MSLQAVLLVAAALFAVGLFGVLGQRSVVMVMMGLELMLGGVVLAAAGVRHFVAPAADEAQVLVVLLVTAMAVEMAVGFAVVTALFRVGEVDTVDAAAELRE
ncbi:NADH-quinone oxidoreductase subunit K [Streptomyces sp. 8K308]|uniref:NADH-quinone oxidoreductase subunit NuoK n=1 Tax=Streptomyces sp. 8K308 TaxID=2530388 RepID=UPI0010488F86|nr:NADH-quinone oxidoreductase subunit K [Streptomyces sp. 8K308]TDC22548.1 NADH-quinone oxidoreductase subunit K [Streptomyces sp. 8K308]